MCIPFRIVAITAFVFACSALALAQTFTTLANFGEEIVRAFPDGRAAPKHGRRKRSEQPARRSLVLPFRWR